MQVHRSPQCEFLDTLEEAKRQEKLNAKNARAAADKEFAAMRADMEKEAKTKPPEAVLQVLQVSGLPEGINMSRVVRSDFLRIFIAFLNSPVLSCSQPKLKGLRLSRIF